MVTWGRNGKVGPPAVRVNRADSTRPASAPTCSSSRRATWRCSTCHASPADSPSKSSPSLHPDLVAGLAKHPGIGFVVVETDARGPVVVSDAGLRVLRDGTVEGDDPLARYGTQIAADLLEHSGRDHVGDIVVCSLLEDSTGEVAAFEELVGCHGGAGGAQTRAMLAHPAEWSPPDGELTSSNQVHEQLVHVARDLRPTTVPAPGDDRGAAVIGTTDPRRCER